MMNIFLSMNAQEHIMRTVFWCIVEWQFDFKEFVEQAVQQHWNVAQLQ